jgi:hypothetical protein
MLELEKRSNTASSPMVLHIGKPRRVGRNYQTSESHINFDSAGYFHFVPEVKNLLTLGRFESPSAHYVSIGNQVAMKEIPSAFLFEEDEYLRANGDVSAAVSVGLFVCGLDQWLLQGGMKNG